MRSSFHLSNMISNFIYTVGYYNGEIRVKSPSLRGVGGDFGCSILQVKRASSLTDMAVGPHNFHFYNEFIVRCLSGILWPHLCKSQRFQCDMSSM